MVKRLILIVAFIGTTFIGKSQFYESFSFSMNKIPEEVQPQLSWLKEISKKWYYSDFQFDNNRGSGFQSFRILTKPLKPFLIPKTHLQVFFDTAQATGKKYKRLPQTTAKWDWPIQNYMHFQYSKFSPGNMVDYFRVGVEELSLSDAAVLAHCFNHFEEYQEGSSKNELFIQKANLLVEKPYAPEGALSDLSLAAIAEFYDSNSEHGFLDLVFSIYIQNKDEKKTNHNMENFFDPLLNVGNLFPHWNKEILNQTYFVEHIPLLINFERKFWKKNKVWKAALKNREEAYVTGFIAHEVLFSIYPENSSYQIEFFFRGKYILEGGELDISDRDPKYCRDKLIIKIGPKITTIQMEKTGMKILEEVK